MKFAHFPSLFRQARYYVKLTLPYETRLRTWASQERGYKIQWIGNKKSFFQPRDFSGENAVSRCFPWNCSFCDPHFFLLLSWTWPQDFFLRMGVLLLRLLLLYFQLCSTRNISIQPPSRGWLHILLSLQNKTTVVIIKIHVKIWPMRRFNDPKCVSVCFNNRCNYVTYSQSSTYICIHTRMTDWLTLVCLFTTEPIFALPSTTAAV